MHTVFNNPSIGIFKRIRGTSNVFPFTDVSLLHERRIVYYYTTDLKLFTFNVDTKKNTEIDIIKSVSLEMFLLKVETN